MRSIYKVLMSRILIPVETAQIMNKAIILQAARWTPRRRMFGHSLNEISVRKFHIIIMPILSKIWHKCQRPKCHTGPIEFRPPTSLIVKVGDGVSYIVKRSSIPTMMDIRRKDLPFNLIKFYSY